MIAPSAKATQANIDNIHMGNRGFGHGGDQAVENVCDLGHVRSEVRKIEGKQAEHVSRGRSPTLKSCRGMSDKLIEVARKLPVVDLVNNSSFWATDPFRP